MFGSIGGPELILIFLVALLIFGPRKLPELGRMLGKGLGEFRRAANDLRVSLETEVARDASPGPSNTRATEALAALPPAVQPSATSMPRGTAFVTGTAGFGAEDPSTGEASATGSSSHPVPEPVEAPAEAANRTSAAAAAPDARDTTPAR